MIHSQCPGRRTGLSEEGGDLLAYREGALEGHALLARERLFFSGEENQEVQLGKERTPLLPSEAEGECDLYVVAEARTVVLIHSLLRLTPRRWPCSSAPALYRS